MDRETFQVMWKMSEASHPAEGCFMRIPQSEHFVGTRSLYAGLNVMPDVRDYICSLALFDNFQFRELDSSELVPGSDSAYSFTTVTIDTAVYLPYLLSRFLGKGGSVV